MQRKQGFPVANCSIKMPDSMPVIPHEGLLEEEEPLQRRQQLVNFGHAQWGFNNWSWSVTKQDLDFVEMTNGKYTAGVVAFVSVTVKTIDIHRENIGYATSLAPNKGSAIHRARKCAVTNALRETLLSFGGSVTTELMEQLEIHKPEVVVPEPPDNQNHQNIQNNQNNQNIQNIPKLIENNQNIQNIPKLIENNQNIINKLEPKNAKPAIRKETPCVNMKNQVNPPIAKAHPMPANLPANRVPANAPRPPAPPVPPAAPRPNSNEVKLEGLTEEEARAERKRRQRMAQEEFRLKHLMKQNDIDDNEDINKNSSIEMLLMAIPSQDIVIEETGSTVEGKRKSPLAESSNTKRRSVYSKLNIIEK